MVRRNFVDKVTFEQRWRRVVSSANTRKEHPGRASWENKVRNEVKVHNGPNQTGICPCNKLGFCLKGNRVPSKGFEQGMTLSELPFGKMSGRFAEHNLQGSKSWEHTKKDIAITQSKD